MGVEIMILFVEAYRRVFLSIEDLDLIDFTKLAERIDQTLFCAIIGNVLHEDSTSPFLLIPYISNNGRDELSRERASSRCWYFFRSWVFA